MDRTGAALQIELPNRLVAPRLNRTHSPRRGGSYRTNTAQRLPAGFIPGSIPIDSELLTYRPDQNAEKMLGGRRVRDLYSLG